MSKSSVLIFFLILNFYYNANNRPENIRINIKLSYESRMYLGTLGRPSYRARRHNSINTPREMNHLDLLKQQINFWFIYNAWFLTENDLLSLKSNQINQFKICAN